MEDRKHFFFLNVRHFLDHLFMLIFATIAALVLTKEWELGYSELIPYATPGLIAFGEFSLPAGWLADLWSREGVMGVFFCRNWAGCNRYLLCSESDSDDNWPVYHWNVCRNLSSCGLGNDHP